MESKEKWTIPCYLCGPYRADSIHLQVKNIRAAEAIGKELWFFGFIPIIPHMNSALMEGAYGLGHEVFLKGDLVLMGLCEFVVAMPLWFTSEGTVEELDKAHQNGQHVYYWDKFLDQDFLRNYYLGI